MRGLAQRRSGFADLFEVQEARILRHWDETRQPDAGSLTIRGTWQDARKGIVINADGADHVGADALTYRTVVRTATGAPC